MPPMINVLDQISVSCSFDSNEQLLDKACGLLTERAKTTRLRSPRRVFFDDEKTVVHEIDCSFLDAAHKTELWFTKKEYDLIKIMNKVIVKGVRLGCFRESKRHTSRGLERYCHRRREQTRWLSIMAVLAEQKHQSSMDTSFPGIIALKYVSAMHDSKEIAASQAQHDAAMVGRLSDSSS